MSSKNYHPAEWAARVQLAACYRIFAMLGWDEMIYNHITVRLPDEVAGNAPQFLINPFGLHYSEVTAHNLLRIDVHGKKLNPENPYPVNPAGFTVHAAIHQGIPDAHCVMHTHTLAGMAVACSEIGLVQNNFYSQMVFDQVAYHDFEGITVHGDEGPRLVANIGSKPLVILRNHGLLAWSNTLPLALLRLWRLQRACETQLAQAPLGASIPISLPILQKTALDVQRWDADFGAGEDLFASLVRRVNRIDASYADAE